MATCQFALESFSEAHASLETALELARAHGTTTIADYRQLAEILNNLGCLSYMSGQPEGAMRFEESLEAQSLAAKNSLYAGSKFSCHSGEFQYRCLPFSLSITLPRSLRSKHSFLFSRIFLYHHSICRLREETLDSLLS